jgi:hypothetical protein
MSFNPPAMPLQCSIGTLVGIQGGQPRVRSRCALRNRANATGYNVSGQHRTFLVVPKLTDLRGGAAGGTNDVVECPSGSKRFYLCVWADDVAKGFPNEYRIGLLVQSQTPPWPVPYP